MTTTYIFEREFPNSYDPKPKGKVLQTSILILDEIKYLYLIDADLRINDTVYKCVSSSAAKKEYVALRNALVDYSRMNNRQ